MLFDVFQQYSAGMPILATVGGLIIGSFLNVVIWRYPIMLRQQMAEFHGEMPSTQSKINLALPRSHCPHCQQTIRVRDNIPLLSWLMLKGRCRDCQAKNQQALSAGGVIDGTRFFAGESGVARKWMGAGGDDIIRLADCRERH